MTDEEVISKIERYLAHQIRTFEESNDNMSDYGNGYMEGQLDGLCYALRLTEKYPMAHSFDLKWAQSIKARML